MSVDEKGKKGSWVPEASSIKAGKKEEEPAKETDFAAGMVERNPEENDIMKAKENKLIKKEGVICYVNVAERLS